ncbi:MAG: DUF937 domain-containing protein [Saprospiraceae bacterium]|nr:DUF937 domain-containing protein [Saprospiraceae bacterium]MCW5923215.1 DUF937 domain-containing protein [Saprospiraceae bacterium]
MDIMQILQNQIAGNTLNQLSQQIGANPQQTKAAATGIFSALLGGLANNAASGGLNSLMAALDKNHNGSILDDMAGLINSGGQGTGALNGMAIVNHILGGKTQSVAQQVGAKSGLNANQIMQLLPVLAPVVMGVIGQLKNNGQLNLGNIANMLLGAAQNGAQQSGLGGALGQVLGGVLAGGGKQGGGLLGGVLGGLFGKK